MAQIFFPINSFLRIPTKWVDFSKAALANKDHFH